jgi:aminoglycoside phosphotransferase (APT) family kinase protein
MSPETETLGGIARDSVEPWLAAHVPDATPPFSYRLLAGGRSNLNFEVRDAAGRSFVLRRPPLGDVLEAAHDMGREHRITSALAPTPVPVARPLAYCADPAVNGAPFYVTEFVEGEIVRTLEDAERAFDEAGRAAAARSLVDVLAGLHAVDPEDVRLGTLARSDGYAERQLKRWHRQFESSKSRDLPEIDEVYRRLTASIPEQQRVAIVHGDYRIDNCVLARDGSVAAVLDWELSTLGDPIADLGLLLVYWVQAGDDVDLLTGEATAAPGFPTRGGIVERYAARSGADVSSVEFFVALGYWRLACIFDGIAARYGAGVMGDDRFSVAASERQVVALAEAALRHTEALP